MTERTTSAAMWAVLSVLALSLIGVSHSFGDDGGNSVETAEAATARHERVKSRRAGTIVICHRGAGEFAHENTLEAYRASLEYGADGNEIDIRQTKDGVLVCFHDDMLDWILDAYGDVSDYTWAELQTFAFQRPGRFGQQCRIPLLREVFLLHRQFGGLIHLDVKRPGYDHLIAKLLDELDMWDHIMASGDNCAVVTKDPRFHGIGYKAGMYLDRSEVDERKITEKLAATGGGVILEEPRLVLQAMGRSIGTPSSTPVSPRAVVATYRHPESDLSVEQLVNVLNDDADWNQVPRTDEAKKISASKITNRAKAADELARRAVRTQEVLQALRRRVERRSLHPEWRYQALDGSAALRALIRLKADDAVTLSRANLWRDDEALEQVKNPEFKTPRSWTDFRMKMIVFRELESLPTEATAQLCRDYLELEEATANRIGPLQFEPAAKTLLSASPELPTVLRLLDHARSEVRGRAKMFCLDNMHRDWVKRLVKDRWPTLVPLGTAHRVDPADRVRFRVTPAKKGKQLVRASIPLPDRFLAEGDRVSVRWAENLEADASARILSFHPAPTSQTRFARRALVTFPYHFADEQAVEFELQQTAVESIFKATLPDVSVTVGLTGDSAPAEVFQVALANQPLLRLRLLAPARETPVPAREEIVESNSHYLWKRYHFADAKWPRIIEIRADALGQVVVIAHVQRTIADGIVAPDIGWQVDFSVASDKVQLSGREATADSGATRTHSFVGGRPVSLSIGDDLLIEHPVAPLKRRGGIEIEHLDGMKWSYRYWRCRAEEKVPMQMASWQQCEMVIRPKSLAQAMSSLGSPHRVDVVSPSWSVVYPHLSQVSNIPDELKSFVSYHRDAVVRSAAIGDDFGNVTQYSDQSRYGSRFGMNRLNHGAAIFEDAWRSGDVKLLETALQWTNNFYDLSVWWGEPERGGTRYNNIANWKQTPPTNDYMWRSDSSVSFCTKGYDCFWFAWEKTGDPRYLEAYRAQVDYVSRHLHAYATTCRNVGDVRDFLHLYRFTGEQKYLDESLRLFRELRGCLSESKLFDEGGKPIDPDPPFIDDDDLGHTIGYAKPYILGYALAGLPELMTYAPDEPDLKETVRAVADYLSNTMDPIGGWRYPHPRSSQISVSYGLEHAWQITQAARAFGDKADPKWLDTIESVLRSRYLIWKKTGRLLNSIDGWETSTQKITSRRDIYTLYKKSNDRDPSRDYAEGNLNFGGASPEGIVYLPEVLSFYLDHRPAARLMMEPEVDKPLGQVLGRANARPGNR